MRYLEKLLENPTADASGTKLAEIVRNAEYNEEDGWEMAMKLKYDKLEKERVYKYGLTPLQLAVTYCGLEVVKDCIKVGCNPNIKTGKSECGCELNITELAFEFRPKDHELLLHLLNTYPQLITDVVIVDSLCSTSHNLANRCFSIIKTKNLKLKPEVIQLMFRLVFYYGHSPELLNSVASMMNNSMINKEIYNAWNLLCSSGFISDFMNFGSPEEMKRNVDNHNDYIAKISGSKPWTMVNNNTGETSFHMVSRMDNTFVFLGLIKGLLTEGNKVKLGEYVRLMYELFVRKNNKGQTCLHLATKHGSYRILGYMLQLIQTKEIMANALMVRDNSGLTPVHTSVLSQFSSLKIIGQVDRNYEMSDEMKAEINKQFNDMLTKHGYQHMDNCIMTKQQLLSLESCSPVKTSEADGLNVVQFAKLNGLRKVVYRKLRKELVGGMEFMNKITYYSLIASYIAIILCALLVIFKEKEYVVGAADLAFVLFSFFAFVSLLKKNPGVVRADRDVVAEIGGGNVSFDVGKLERLVRKEYCPECMIVKEARVKHCGKCNQCVGEFDHCCGFIDNDVGEGNRKSFVFFVSFNGVPNMCWSIHFIKMIFSRKAIFGSLISSFKAQPLIILTSLIHFSYGLFTSFLTISNLYLIVSGITSYEADHLSEAEQKKRAENKWQNIREFIRPNKKQ